VLTLTCAACGARLAKIGEETSEQLDYQPASLFVTEHVTGRKNWLFCGNDVGGIRAAILYSVVATCKAHGIDPWAYLRPGSSGSRPIRTAAARSSCPAPGRLRAPPTRSPPPPATVDER
jgi:hypothetical protein